VTLGTDEAHGEQGEIGLELELRSGDWLERQALLGADGLDANRMQRGDVSLAVAGDLGVAIE
jgi:hypothetical protein